jgi:flagellar FliJ protein
MAFNPVLDLVIQVSTDRRDGAALALAGSRRQADEAQRKLDLLSRYHHDYLVRINEGTTGGHTDVGRIANNRAFIAKLESAIAQQEREMEACESYLNACYHQLSAEEQKLKSLETLRERRSKLMRLKEGRRDQGRTDEFAARAARLGDSIFNNRTT